MNIKRLIYVLIIILLTMNVVFLPCKSYARTFDGIMKDGDGFVDAGSDPETVLNKVQVQTTSKTIYKVLLTIGICISVIIGAVLGIQFMFGSVEGKVKVQEALVPYIVGCFVVFGAFAIWKIVINIGQSV